MRTIRRSLPLLALAVAGCAGIRVYSDPALTHETGVKVFAPKPYLLVARTGAKDAPVELSIVYLPDPDDVLYIRQQRGWGSNELGIGLSNGMLTQLGSKSDAQAADTTKAVATLLTAAAAAYQDTRPRLPRESPAPDLADTADTLRLIAQDLVQATTTASSPATPSQAASAQAIADAIDRAADNLPATAPAAAAAALVPLLPRIDGLKIDNPPTGNNAMTAYNSRIDTLAAQLRTVLDQLGPGSTYDATFELYEIRQRGGRTTLVRVDKGRQ